MLSFYLLQQPLVEILEISLSMVAVNMKVILKKNNEVNCF